MFSVLAFKLALLRHIVPILAHYRPISSHYFEQIN